jgi:hypothetical protein
MVEATYVLYVPRSQRVRVRTALAGRVGDAVTLRERKTLFGSEFYFSGPAGLARESHTSAMRWLEEAAWRR